MTTVVSPSSRSFRLNDAAGSALAIVKAFSRGNPSGDLEADILAVNQAFILSTFQDFTAPGVGTFTNTVVTPNGPIQLAPGSPVTLSTQTADFSVNDQFLDNKGGPVRHWIDFFFDPSVIGSSPITLSSILVRVGRDFNNNGYFPGQFLVTVTRFDQNWNRVPLGDQFIIHPSSPSFPGGAGTVTIDLTQGGTRQLVIDTGRAVTTTGPGYNGATGQIVSVNPEIVNGVEYDYLTALIGFSIGFEVHGTGNGAAFICCNASGSAPAFNTNLFWRSTANRWCGPYDPSVAGPSVADTNQNPGDQHLATGAIPGYGAIALPNGIFSASPGWLGRSKEVQNAGAPQLAIQSWDQPYHTLQALAFASSGTAVLIGGLTQVPVNPVTLQLSTTQPIGTSITFTLAGSSSGPGGPWTNLGAVVDGQIVPGYQYYQLTATLNADTHGFATPTLMSWNMTEAVTIGTVGWLDDFDSTATIDPLTGQASIAELKLPILRAGPRDFRDLATYINTNFSPANIAAYVYAKDLVTGARYFLNSYHLENRNPSDIQEEMTFVSGLDRLSAQIPPAVESFVFPNNAPSIACTGVSWFVQGPVVTAVIQFEGALGTPFATVNYDGFTLIGVSNVAGGNQRLDGVALFIVPFNTVHAYPNPGQVYPNSATQPPPSGFNNRNCVSVVLQDANQTYGFLPNVGDTFQIHSGQFVRADLVYSAQDFANVYTDLIENQAQVPLRLIGSLPVLTGRTTTTRIAGTNGQPIQPGEGASSGTSGLDILAAVAMHCDGLVAWERGQIHFVNLFAPVDTVMHWDDRHIENIDFTIGADRRCPSVIVKYGFSSVSNSFAFEAQFNDADALAGWGLPNLFDIYRVPDPICQWSDVNEAPRLARKYLNAWSTGVRVWGVDTVFWYPWLQMGDAVSIQTSDYTDRAMSFSADGTVDTGSPVLGKVTVVGIIVGKNLLGDQFLIAVRGLQDITFATSVTTTRDGPTNAIPCPVMTLNIVSVITASPFGDIGALEAQLGYIPPNNPYFAGIQVQVQQGANPPTWTPLNAQTPIKIDITLNAGYTLTPYCVTTAGVFSVGPVITIPGQTRGLVLTPGTTGADGATTNPVVTRPQQPISARDGATVTFPQALQNIPTVIPRRAISNEFRALWGSDAQTIAQSGNTTALNTGLQVVDESAAIMVSSAGFVARNRLSQPGASTTPQSASFPSTQIPPSSIGAGLSLGANLPAFNDTYTGTATLFITVSAVLGGGGSVSIPIYLDVSINSGSSWTQVANATATISNITAAGNYAVAVPLVFTETGIPASTTMVRLRTGALTKSVALSADYVEGDSVNWATNSATTLYASTTPNATDAQLYDATTTT